MSMDPRPSTTVYQPQLRPWTVRHRATPSVAMPPMTQRYHVAWLDKDGDVEDFVRMGPADSLFTDAFNAVVRGAILSTPDGPMAIEDLQPGMQIVTTGGPQTLLWKGSHTVRPGAKGQSLYRLPADAMGMGRPSPDLVLGTGARIVSNRSSLRALIGADQALLPVEALADGQSVIRITPISAVQCFHLGFARHRTFCVNGIDVESVHPGRLDPALGADLHRFYMAMFPHIAEARDFGPLSMARLSPEQAEALVAA